MALSRLHLASWPHELLTRASKFGDIELHLEARTPILPATQMLKSRSMELSNAGFGTHAMANGGVSRLIVLGSKLRFLVSRLCY